MRKDYKTNDTEWVDLVAASVAERANLSQEYNVPVGLMEMLETDAVRPMVQIMNGWLLVTLFIAKEAPDATSARQLERLDCLVREDILITLHGGELAGLYPFEKLVAAAALRSDKRLATGWDLWQQLMQQLYRRVADELDELGVTMERVEQRLYDGDEDRMVQIIARLNRSLVIQKRALDLHDFIYTRLLAEVERGENFPTRFGYSLQHLQAEYEHLLRILASTKEIMNEVRESGQLLLTNRTNRFMMILTIIAFTTIPVTVASEFSTIGIQLPFVDTDQGKLIVLLTAFVIALCLLGWFKYKRWIW